MMSVVNNENLIRQQLKILISGGSLQNSGADNLLYPPHDNVCNFFDAEYLLEPKKYIYNLSQLAYPVFPKNLPPVPERSDIVIKTDDPVPCDGIWEPVKIQYNHKLLVIKTDISGFKNLGAYNYFIRGMNAPRQVYYDVLIESDTEMVIPDDPIRYRDVHWRLVWEDTRYCDGIIPDESEYFLDDEPGKRITCQSGERCPHSGHWATLAGGHQQFIDIQEGALMPRLRNIKVICMLLKFAFQRYGCF